MELKRYADAHEAEHGRFPKTLIFAANDLPHTSHADQLVDQARDIFGQGDPFVAKITGRVDRPLRRIREFRNRAKPGIVVTVDLLTTGVDIPDLEFLVFLRPVKSRILFEQMLGRGTRLGERATDKDRFVVFDCFDGTLVEYFAGTTGITAEPLEGDGKSVAQIVEEVWQNKDRAYNTKRLVRRLRRIDKNMSGDARDRFARFIDDGDVGHFAKQLPSLLHHSFTPTMQTLRDGDFLRLLEDYPRAPRSFIIAAHVTDQVSSEWLIKGADGTQYKPTDYLKAFADFVRGEAEKIDALSVLLSRPSHWRPETLVALRDALKAVTQENLEPRRVAVARRPSLARLRRALRGGGRPSPSRRSAAVAVHHRGQVQPPLPRPDVGDIRAPQPIDRDRVKVTLYQVGGGPDARHPDRRAPAPTRDLPRELGAAHQPLHALAAHPDVVTETQLGVHARRPVSPARLLMDLGDLIGQARVLTRPQRRPPPIPRVKTRARDPQHAAHDLDRVLSPLSSDKPEDPHRVTLSLAKKAAAFLSVSRSSVTTRSSRRNRRSSSRSTLVNPCARPSSTSSWPLQVRNDCGETPSSAASWGTDLPLLLSSAIASRRKSNE